MGQPKALLDWHSQPLILAHCMALQRVCSQIVVVLGSEAQSIQAVLPSQVDIRINRDWAHTQMVDSLQIGLSGIDGPCVVTPVDTAPAPERILQQLIEHPTPVVPQFEGMDGHPVWIDSKHLMDQITRARLDVILAHAPRLEVDWEGCVKTWNTPSEWATYWSSSAESRSSKADS